MSDRELADKVVSLDWQIPEGWYPRFGKKDGKWFVADDAGIAPLITAGQFVRDWRVAGALMEKRMGKMEMLFVPERVEGESLPRAIIEACVAALGSKES